MDRVWWLSAKFTGGKINRVGHNENGVLYAHENTFVCFLEM